MGYHVLKERRFFWRWALQRVWCMIRHSQVRVSIEIEGVWALHGNVI
jgi:hypothetical protein